MIHRLRLLTIVIDYLLVVLSFCLAYWARVGFIDSTDFPFGPYMTSALVTAFVWILVLFIFRGYSVKVRLDKLAHLSKVLIAGITGPALFIMIFYFNEQVVFSRLLLIYSSVFGVVLMAVFHLLMQLIENKLIKKGYGTVRLLIIGSNRGVKQFIQQLKKEASPYLPVAILDGYGTSEKEIAGVPVLGKLNILEKTVDEKQIDAIVQGDNIEQAVNIVNFCEQNDVDYYLLPYLLGIFREQVGIEHLEMPVIALSNKDDRSWFKEFIG